MLETRLEEVVAAMAGAPTGPVEGIRVTGVSTDSRTVEPGELFVAVAGENHDGHDFVEQAVRTGAAACVVSRPVVPATGLCIQVDDTVLALGRWAAEYRRRRNAAVVAVTGSNGKTTAKAMIDHVLGSRLPGRAAVKSFNNHLGVPLTLLSGEAGDAYLVVEIGSNAPGEVDQLAALTAPDIGVITSIGAAHLEGFGSIEGVVREKTALLRHIRPGGLAVVNADRPETRAALGMGGQGASCANARCALLDPAVELVSFGVTDDVGLRVTDVRSDLTGTRFRLDPGTEIRLPICGAHNALNAAAVVAVCRRMGLADAEVAAALATFRPADMRLNVSRPGPITIIDDSYNANPSSMRAAIDVLASSEGGRRVLVAGDMLELGDQGRTWHEDVGAYAAEAGVELVVAVGSHAGELAEAARGRNALTDTLVFDDAEQACADLEQWARPGDVILVKGSRAMGMERVVRAAEAAFADRRVAATG